jgi:enoyl-CoA hydratase/carnithine racemase
MTGTVLSNRSEGVCTITLSRPERLNAINPELLEDLHAALARANDDPETRVLILAGAGRAFCAGDDLKEFDRQSSGEAETQAYVNRIQDITRQIVCGDKVVIGAIRGWAVGGGLEWMINCDLAILADDTRCFFPELSLGLFVTGGVTALLPRLVGLQKARELILFGERFDAQAALEMGLAWKVVPLHRLAEEAMAAARRVAALPQGSVRDLKRVLRRAADLDLEDCLALEAAATVRGFLDPATAERVAGFGRDRG